MSGDVLAHRFDCMFAKPLPGTTPEEYTVFRSKTIEYEVSQLGQPIRGVTFYGALGNNDSTGSIACLTPLRLDAVSLRTVSSLLYVNLTAKALRETEHNGPGKDIL